MKQLAQLIREYPEVVTLLEYLLKTKTVPLSDIGMIINWNKNAVKDVILPVLMREGILERYHSSFKTNSEKIAKALTSIGNKVITIYDVKTIADFCKMPNARDLAVVLASGRSIRQSSIATTLHITKQETSALISMLIKNGVIQDWTNGSYKGKNTNELCELLKIDTQQESVDAHKKSLVPWDWFVDDINRLRVVLKVVSMDANGRHIDSVKAAAIAGELGVSKSEFVASYAPTLIAREALAHIGKNYTRGARFKEYVSIITAEADNELPTIGKYKPTKLTAEQKRRSRENTKASIKTMEKRRKNALASAKEWRDSEMFTKKEYEMRVDEINSEYDALIKNLANTATKGA